MIKHDSLALVRTLHKQHKPCSPLSPFIFLTDCQKATNIESTISSLPHDSTVIIRDYDHPNRAEYIHQLASLCNKLGLAFMIAEDIDLACKLGAIGLHVRQFRLSEFRGLRKSHPELVITTSCHNEAELTRARHYGCDAVFISPVFATTSHPHAQPLGFKGLCHLAALSFLPVYAVGGINSHSIPLLNKAPIAGVGGIDMFIGGSGEIVG